ncbi:GrpB family protein [Patescibacteria group bacterium]|nr:GrpB family protein [Patescibacteria group bacterium]MBU4274982.1 GrpB family protein [Patescibacteria group bacterium]MBU4462189.1 GrpB family protein [Patescibacteria group bacterium]
MKIIGLQSKKVRLFSYNPAWKRLYKEEEKLLRFVIGKYVLDIQHVGSTSIPGAKAKPIIDIAIGVKNLKEGEKCIKPLKQLGYEYKHNAGIKGRHFFVKGNEINRTHYVHIEKLDGRLWKNHIIFRDYLRKYKETVKEYNELKEKLAKKYKDDRDTYTAWKDSFIQGIIKKAEKD